MGKNRPSNARILRRQCDDGDVYISSIPQAPCPGALRIVLAIDDSQVRARSVYKERAQTAVSTASDRAESRLATARMLPWNNPEGGGIVAPAFKDVRIAHARHQRGCGLRSDRLDLHEPARRFTGRQRANLTIVRRDAPVKS
jgi:hypothetical protein